MPEPPNKGMKLTSVEHTERSQLIPGVGRTHRRPTTMTHCNRLIRPYEHNYFRGVVVSVKRRGRRWVKYFSDHPDGRRAAVRRAREYRDGLVSALPPVNKLKHAYVRNTTGLIGVSRVKERTRAGHMMIRYVASLPRMGRSPGKASFSVALHGESAARRMAVAARRRGVADFLAELERAARRDRRGRPTRAWSSRTQSIL
jgi:hypothetical protein